jgi:hypothetical protein
MRREFTALRPEFVPLEHQADGFSRAPNDFRPCHQLEPATVFEGSGPTHGHIDPRSRFRPIGTAKAQSSAAHIHSLGTNCRVPFVGLEDRVPSLPPEWKPSRSASLNLIHALMIP